MATLIYAPSVEVHIATFDGTVIDVTEDVQRSSLSRIRGGVSTFSVDLLNQNRKYDGLFSPMDRIVVYMRRIRRMLVFSGYLDTVPLFSAKPTSVTISASCTLKRIQNFMWDPRSSAAQALFAKDMSPVNQTLTDGGLANRTLRLLNEVAGWPKEQIHIGSVPSKWFETVKDVADRLAKEAEILDMISTVGAGGYTSGTNPIADGLTTIAGVGPGTGTLPDFIGKISWFGGPGGGAYGGMALTGESGTHPADQWYCAMRWPYLEYRGGSIAQVAGVDQGKAKAWWKNRRLLVVNPDNGRAICVRAADWGPGGVPSADRRVIDVSKTALKALGASTDTTVHIAFAPDGMALGARTAQGVDNAPSSSAQLGQTLKNSGAIVSSDVDWGHPENSGYEKANIVSITAGGVTVKVNKNAAGRFSGFLNDLAASGYKIRQGDTYGFNIRPITGGTGYSNHAYGAAVDINSSDNPYTHGTAAHTMPDTTVRQLCAKWGLYWGGDYNSLKDYMHVEVIGAPRTPKTSNSAHPELEAGGYASSSGTGSTDASQQPMDVVSQVSGALFNVFQWINSSNFGGTLLSGVKALMNDEPLMPTVANYMSAALREFCSAPNGDFIAWFPDYFGFWGTAPKLVIEDIELKQSFSVAWSDENLKTHVFVTGSTSGTEGFGDATEIYQQLGTSGIASVEFPEMMKAFFNENPALYQDNAKAYLSRMGPRVLYEPMENITGPRAEFFFACMKFMQNWAQQFAASFETTFMPEAFPGMLCVLPKYGVQCYVAEVQHNTDSESGFSTTIHGQAWSQIGNAKIKIRGLPNGAPL